MGLATLFGILTSVFGGILMGSSAFYWYALSGSASQDPQDGLRVAMDAIHASFLFVFGLMGLLAGLKLGFPLATVVTMVILFVVAVGLLIETIFFYTLYSCDKNPLQILSSIHIMFCNDGPTSVYPGINTKQFAMAALFTPLGAAWLAAVCCLVFYILMNQEEQYYFED